MNAVDKLRGHKLLPEHMSSVPRLYETEGLPFERKTIHVRFFTSAGRAQWLLAEYDPAERLAFGWCDLGLGGAEWGYFSLRELEDLFVVKEGFPIIVERDLPFRPKPFRELHR